MRVAYGELTIRVTCLLQLALVNPRLAHHRTL